MFINNNKKKNRGSKCINASGHTVGPEQKGDTRATTRTESGPAKENKSGA